MNIWLDASKEAPDGFVWTQSVDMTKSLIIKAEESKEDLFLDIAYDLGKFAKKGGNGAALMKWLYETNRFYPVVTHEENPEIKQKMQTLIDRFFTR